VSQGRLGCGSNETGGGVPTGVLVKRRDFLKTGSAALAGAAVGSRASGQRGGAEARAETPQTAPPIALAPRFGDARDWWFRKRFGLFVHWGLYAINGFHEQEQWRRRVPRQDYARLAAQWNPAAFEPDAWLDLMREAGMSYVCVTMKHHDGFCLWDTTLTRYNTMNTPFGRDILRMLADACHRRGVPLCLYYSIADWNHPNYPNQGRHHELPPQPQDQPDLPTYLEFLRGQVRELCTNYGEISGFWWDMNVDRHVDPSVNAMIRRLQPSAVINDRGFDPGDFGTPERDTDTAGEELLSFSKRTEACQSVGVESWGYRRDESYYTDRHLLRSIDKYLARDANYLLNVGPKPDGAIPAESAAILRRIGRWHAAVGESFDGTLPASDLTANRNVLLTRRGRTLYVHLHRDPVGDAVKLKPIARAPTSATLLNTGRPVTWALDMAPSDHAEQAAYLRLTNLPANEFANSVMVVKLEFDGNPEGGAPAGTG
jgi:alpha-L-fucosidase